jgi:hypothetical protein
MAIGFKYKSKYKLPLLPLKCKFYKLTTPPMDSRGAVSFKEEEISKLIISKY